MPDSATKRTPMSDEHKAALAEGRDQGRAVRRYLEALEAHRPRRGRKRTPDSMKKRLDSVEKALPSADPGRDRPGGLTRRLRVRAAGCGRQERPQQGQSIRRPQQRM